jgi:hypothetical protein
MLDVDVIDADTAFLEALNHCRDGRILRWQAVLRTREDQNVLAHRRRG